MLERYLSKKRAEVVNRLIPSYHRKGRILDIGCGEHPYFLIDTIFNNKYGIDISAKECTKDKSIIIKNSDIEKDGLLGFESEYFDVVTMLAVFEHLDPNKLSVIVREIKRVLKSKGIFILTTPAPWTSVILEALSAVRLVNPEMIKEHKGLYGAKKISDILTESGFSRENVKFGSFELFMNTWSLAIKK
ncbi:class I SAM-dependent methyltransferase [Candidatus Omnitrophota bacterium]